MTSLAIIPARGGSVRVPRKNLCRVGGATLIERAILSAWPCDAIVVASDDADIREHAVRVWADRSMAYPVIGGPRPPSFMALALDAETAAGTTHLEDVIAAVLREVPCPGCDIGDPDVIVLLQPTSPFRTMSQVTKALAELRRGWDCVLSVTPSMHLHPRFNGNTAARDVPRDTTALDRYVPREIGPRPFSQTLGHLVHENGAIYAFTREHWNRRRNRGVAHGDDRCGLVEMHWSEAIDIDWPEDLAAAQRLASCVTISPTSPVMTASTQGSSLVKPADIRPTAMAILSMDDTIEGTRSHLQVGVGLVAAAAKMARALLAGVHGEPTPEERSAWLSLTPDARRLLLEATKAETLRGGR